MAADYRRKTFSDDSAATFVFEQQKVSVKTVDVFTRDLGQFKVRDADL